MLLYISSNENVGIFDFLSNDHGMVIKKLSGTFSLKQFVMHDMRSLNHYSYFAIDLKALKDSEEEIIEAIKAFKSMFTSRVIFYVEDVKGSGELIYKLINEGIYNIVSSDTVDELKKEIIKATSDLGISESDIKMKFMDSDIDKERLQAEYSFKSKNIKIAVTGLIHRVGTTTMAINMANYLAGIGARVCYIEANSHGHLMQLPDAYDYMTIVENSIICNGVKYLTLNAECHDEFDFIIYDMGVIEAKIINAIKNKCEIAILCVTAKPYEIKDYERVVSLFEIGSINTIFSFVNESEKMKIQNKYGSVYFSQYSPDLFDGNSNQMTWESILENYIIKN